MTTIAYLDRRIILAPSNQEIFPTLENDILVMDDTHPDQCFDELIAGHNVWVRCTKGLRPFVECIHARFRHVKAAGGLVCTPEGGMLTIFREGKWDLPKGKVEPGESLRLAALREVAEETGVSDLETGKLVAKTYHIYDKYGGWHFKQTSWFAMRSPNTAATKPQTEEDIAQAIWLDRNDSLRRISQSFASLQDLAGIAQSFSF